MEVRTILSAATAASLALVLLQLMTSTSSCEAKIVSMKAELHQKSGLNGLQASDGKPPGYNYRPPIVNYKYHGGPVLSKPIHVYFVWYGRWTASEKAVIKTAVRSLTPPKPIKQFPNLSNLWKLVTKYYEILPDGKRRYATKKVLIKGEVDDHYSNGTAIDGNAGPSQIIKSHLGKELPYDIDQGVYFMLTSADVNFTGSGVCGYHYFECIDETKGAAFCGSTDHPIPQNTLVYSFVPIPSAANQLKNSCNDFATGGIQGTPPNHLVSPDGALDSAIDTLMHELLELTVDPYVNAWIYNETENSEAADVCTSTYVAGDFYYCDFPDIYPDYPGGVIYILNPNCSSFNNYAERALREPKSTVSFNQFGLDGSKYLVQKFWNLATKGCASQPEEACEARRVVLHKAKGTIQRGLFYNGVGLQTYAPAQHCQWEIRVRKAKEITLTFELLALGYDDLDYVKVTQNGHTVKKLTGFGKNVEVVIREGSKPVWIEFITYSGRSPYPDSAGFIMHYTATF